MKIDLNGFAFEISLTAFLHGQWVNLPMTGHGAESSIDTNDIHGEFVLSEDGEQIHYRLKFQSPFRTRVRLKAKLLDQQQLFHLIPGNIHGDNNAAHVRPGEFPCLTSVTKGERNRSPLWEFRADRASHPVSILCCENGAVGISIDPYSACGETDGGFIRNGLFAELPGSFGVSLGYGNDPLTFVEKTHFEAATADLCRNASASGTIFAAVGGGRLAAHRIIRSVYDHTRQLPVHKKSYSHALRALADAFIQVNWSEELQQYTNRKCELPSDSTLRPWRAIVEIGWTGGSMLAYPFALAEQLFPDLKFPRSSAEIFDQICGGFNQASGLLNDTTLNRFTKNRPEGWNASTINGWWSGFLPQTLDSHCAYTNAHAAFYLLKAAFIGADWSQPSRQTWIDTALQVLNTAVDLQRSDGAFGYIFSNKEKKVTDWDGFAGCWFAAALVYAWKITGKEHYRQSADRAMRYYWPFVRDLACWGSPMDTFKSIDSEGNLAFIRTARLLHEHTSESVYLEMLRDGAHYEYLWRYGFRARPQCPPLKESSWNSCGGSITSVSNPHIHPMSVVATEDFKYLARQTGDSYHDKRAEDGIAWLMNTMELYPEVVGYGRYGVLSERTCPSDGLLAEKYDDDGSPASTWWSYNAWAAGSAMEALGERLLAMNDVGLVERARR